MTATETRVINGKTYVRITGNKVVSPGSPPDIDTDFHTEHRDAAFEHVGILYGRDHVARLPTNQMLKTRASLKDAARVYGVPPAQANYITSLLPDSLGITFGKVYAPDSEEYSGSQRFREAVATRAWEKPLACAKALEGRIRGRGVHACGLLISSAPLYNHIPVDTAKDGTVVAGFEYGACEQIGIIKFDFLGLDTVDILCDAVRLAVSHGKTVPDFRAMVRESRFDDVETFRLLGRGETVGVFQLGNSAVADLFKRFTPSTLGDISAITALYRPGPMSAGSHIQYVERRAGREPIQPIHPEFAGTAVERILGDTCGLLVYQEQVMALAADVAGMSPQEGDDLRRAIGKKKHDLMVAYEERFISGGVSNGFSAVAMKELWDRIVGFAEYGFNKSHSDAYAAMAYLALYVKAHFPAEFYASAIARKVSMGAAGRDKVFELVEDAKRRGIRLDVPDINVSGADIGMNAAGNLSFGFSMLKGVGSKDSEVIVAERDTNGCYTSFKDFIVRSFNAGRVTKTTYEALVKAGAFDSLGVSRKVAYESVVPYLDLLRKERAKRKRALVKEAKALGAEPPAGEPPVTGETLPEDSTLMGDDYPLVERLRYEAEVAGQYMTGHPMGSVPKRVPVMRTVTIGELLQSTQPVKGAVIMAAVVAYSDKTHKKFGRKVSVTLDDGTGIVTGYSSNSLLKLEDAWAAQQTVKEAYLSGAGAVDSSVITNLSEARTLGSPAVQPFRVYSFHVNYTPERKVLLDDGSVSYKPPYLSILHAREVPISASGGMCARLRIPWNLPVEEAISSVRDALSTCPPSDKKFPLLVARWREDMPNGGADTVEKFLEASRQLSAPAEARDWGSLMPPSTEPLPQSATTDLLEYEEVPVEVPFVKGAFTALNQIFGANAFDWGHYSIGRL
jgi:DNA polymerase III, alpha subunit